MPPLSSNQKLPRLITGDEVLAKFAKRLQGTERVAIDTEAASYHRYNDRIYLLQLSTDSETVIIDPLAVTKLDPIGKLLRDREVEVVFHDADYDLRVLDRDYRFRAGHVFDTKIAAQLLGEPAVGLGALLAKYFGLQLNKKLQRADWSRRPLTPDMIEYAAADTRYLLALRDELDSQLHRLDRQGWAREEFKQLETVRWNSTNGNGQAFLRLKGAKALTPRSRAVLKAVHGWRESKASDVDRAPFRVLGNDALLALAKGAPTTRAALGKLSGVPTSTVRRYGEELLGAVRSGLATPPSRYPTIERSKRPKIDRDAKQRLDRLKGLRNGTAKRLGVDVGVLCPNGTLEAITRATPSTVQELRKVSELRKWQRAALGEKALLEALNTNKSA
jgi:ribonuclease D